MDEEKRSELPIVESDIRTVKFEDRLSDLIGERYQRWKAGELIFIHASTGLGKTYFILIYLYEYVKQMGVEIVILVNRRLLKKQLWEEIRRHDLEANEREVQLHLFTYQELEGDGEQVEWKKKIVKRCRYIVCDECHYFLSDSTFNSGVQKSFDFIASLYRDATLIFLSATMEYIRPQIEKRVIELHQEYVNKWEGKKIKYEEDVQRECQYKANGERRGLSSFMHKLQEKEESYEYQEDMNFYLSQMTEPAMREYQFLRDISANVKVHYFNDLKDMLALIQDASPHEKWLIFVSSKNTGREMRENLVESGMEEKKVVYIDAEYDTMREKDDSIRKLACEEVRHIVETGHFQCNILIATTVLDNGVSIQDESVQNIVLMTDDDVEFQQMLGRKRFMRADEKLKIFISSGSQGTFRKRETEYFRTYWDICVNRGISLYKAQQMLLEEPVKSQKFLTSYYTFDGFDYQANELAIEEIRRKQLYCSKVEQQLKQGKSFFLKEQLEWIGMNYTKEWENSANISVTKEEVDEIQRKLQMIYDAGGIMDKQDFGQFGDELMTIAAKIDGKNFTGKSGSIATIKKAFRLREEWRDFQIQSCGDRSTYYEILLNGNSRHNFPANFTLEILRKLVNDEETDDLCEIYKRLFSAEVPQCLADNPESLKVFINTKLKVYPELGEWIIRQTGKGETKKYVVGKRPNSTTE